MEHGSRTSVRSKLKCYKLSTKRLGQLGSDDIIFSIAGKELSEGRHLAIT
jgi:hypothetical protein